MYTAEDRCNLRFATGIALSVALAYGFGWTMSWLAPVLTCSFLGNRAPRPDLKASTAIVAAILAIFGFWLLLTLFIYHYAAVFALLFSMALYLNFYMAARGVSKLIVLLSTMATLLIPLLGGPLPAIALAVSEGFLISALVALLCTQVAHMLIPGGTRAPVAGQVGSDLHPLQSAWLSTAVILPVALICLAFNLSGALLPLIMIAMLSQRPDFSTGAAGGKALILANLGGGLVAIAFYQLLRISPTYPFLVAGLFALALLFGQRIFSSRPTAPLYATAFSTVLILIGSGTGEYGADTGAAFYKRILLITLAVFYVVGALSLLQMPAVRQRWMGIGRWLGGKLSMAGA